MSKMPVYCAVSQLGIHWVAAGRSKKKERKKKAPILAHRATSYAANKLTAAASFSQKEI